MVGGLRHPCGANKGSTEREVWSGAMLSMTAASALGEPWSSIANAIAMKGRVCEQEALHAEVLGSLSEALEVI